MRRLAPVTPCPGQFGGKRLRGANSVVGAGVIGSVYAGHLLRAGHSVTLCARGRRLTELRDRGLILEDAQTGKRISHQVHVVEAPDAGTPCDVVVVAVRRDQMLGTVSGLANVPADVVFFGNAAGLAATLANTMGSRALFGFPAAAEVHRGAAVRFVLIRQQKTMLADTDHRRSPRVKALAKALRSAGFPVTISTDAEAWLTAHAAFVVPIQFAFYRVDVEPQRLAADDALLTTMVRATRQAFRALQSAGNTQIPRNLRALYLLMPERFVVRYWRTTGVVPRRAVVRRAHPAAPEEMASLPPPFDLP